MQKSYGNYGRAYRSNRKRVNIGGTIAMVLATLVVLSAGVLIGMTYSNLIQPSDPAGSTSSQTESKPTSEVESQPEEKPFELPAGTQTEALPTEPEVTFESIPLEEVSAANYVVIDRLSGAVLLEKNSTNRIYPASTTKIMTAAVALELGNLDSVLTTTNTALGLLSYNASKIGLVNGEQMTLRDLLYAQMLPSACDASNVIADQSSLGYSGFVTQMYTTAKDIGCTDTYFVNPSGIHSSAHFSTVTDIARIAAYASLNPVFREIVSTDTYVLPASNVHDAGWHVMENSNPLLNRTDLLFPEGEIIAVNGTKTGTTYEGGYSLVCSAVTKGGAQLIAVISGIPHNNSTGAYVRVPDMVAILKAAAAVADSGSQAVVSSDKPLNDAVALALPETLEIVPAYGISLAQSEKMLENGTRSIFYNASALTVSTVYYKNLETAVNEFVPGSEVTVGYLKVVDSVSGSAPVDSIPLILREK